MTEREEALEEAATLCDAINYGLACEIRALKSSSPPPKGGEGWRLVPVSALEPFAKYYRSRMAIKMRGVDDVIHRIHPGSEHKAEISVSDCGRLAALLAAAPDGKAMPQGEMGNG